MFETDRLPDGWSSRLNYMDEIWVYPSTPLFVLIFVRSPSLSLFFVLILLCHNDIHSLDL